MNKIYINPEIEIVLFEEEDIMTQSTNESFDPEGILGGNADKWPWEN